MRCCCKCYDHTCMWCSVRRAKQQLQYQILCDHPATASINHSWKWAAMIWHPLLHLLLSAAERLQPCYLLPPINSNHLLHQITHTHTHRTGGNKKCVSTKIIPSLNVISSAWAADKLHSSVIKADLEWFTCCGQDKINMIRSDKYWGWYFWRLGN